MNVLISKKVIVTALIFMMLFAFTQRSLPAAKERRGATVEVTMVDGSRVKGELLAVKSDALIINDLRGGERLDLQQVVQIKRLKKPNGLLGIAIGLGVGFGINYMQHDQHKQGLDGLFNYFLPPIAGLMGAIIGENRPPEKFFRPGELPQIREQNLERLKRYAREQD
jgi:hypothetical protein